MRRTCLRPLPTGKVAPNSALLFGVILILSGTFLLTTNSRNPDRDAFCSLSSNDPFQPWDNAPIDRA